MHARIGWQNLRTSEFLDSGNYMLITGTDFEDGAINFDTCHYVERERYEQDKHIQIKNGSILITKDGTLGKVAYVQGLSMPATLNAGVFNVEIKDETKVDNKYLFQYLKAPYLMDYVDKKATGGTIKHLNQNILIDFPVVMPSKQEQWLIGAYFNQLDYLITLHQCKESAFSEWKDSGFLQKHKTTWEQRKSVDIADYSKGNGYSKSDLTENGTPIILYGRLYTKYQFAIAEVDTFATPKDGSIYSQGNEVIIPASGETAEDIARASAVEKSGVLLGGDLNILRPFNFINPLFLALTISNGEPQKELAKKAQGKSVVHIHNSDIQEVTVSFPTRAEQDRIVAVFRSLDNLITLHQCKCDYLIRLKYGVFSLLNKTDWEQRKLSEIYQNIGNAFVGTATPYYVEHGHFYLESNNIKDGQINHNSEIFINDEFYERQKDKWLHTGDMVMVQSGHVGHTAVIPEELDNSAAHALIMFRNPKVEIDPYFLNYQYQTNKSKKKIENITTGNTIKHILASDMQEFTVDTLKIEEQQHIARYFLELDHLITLHQQKLKLLKQIKKAMVNCFFYRKIYRKK